MPMITSTDGTRLYYEEAGTGTPVVFVHEFAGDYRTWEPQMRHFARGHRCVTFSARGYPPSDVPDDPARYGQEIARGDVIAIMDALGIVSAHIVGHSMGAYTALHVGIRNRDRCISVTAAGCGWGSVADPAEREAMRKVAAENAKLFTENSIAEAAAIYARQPDAAQPQIQGSARICGICPDACGTFRARPRTDNVDAASKAPNALGHGSGFAAFLRTASRHRRRRG